MRKLERERKEHRTDQVIRYLTPSQLETMYASVKANSRLEAIARLLHRSEARVGELLALELHQIN